jgi:hypothetical protein
MTCDIYILQQKGKDEQVLERAKVTHQDTKKCQSHATNPYFISHLVPHHLQHYATLLLA